MGAVVVMLGIIGLGVLMAYLKFPPAYAKPTLVSTFNKMVMAVCALFCLLAVLNVRGAFVGGENEKLWIPVAIAAALGVEIVVLAVCFVIRNFYVFRPPRRPGGF